jgi:hypothetical protein
VVAASRCYNQVEKAVIGANHHRGRARCMPRGVWLQTRAGRPRRRVLPPELTGAGQGSGLGLMLIACLMESGEWPHCGAFCVMVRVERPLQHGPGTQA